MRLVSAANGLLVLQRLQLAIAVIQVVVGTASGLLLQLTCHLCRSSVCYCCGSGATAQRTTCFRGQEDPFSAAARARTERPQKKRESSAGGRVLAHLGLPTRASHQMCVPVDPPLARVFRTILHIFASPNSELHLLALGGVRYISGDAIVRPSVLTVACRRAMSIIVRTHGLPQYTLIS